MTYSTGTGRAVLAVSVALFATTAHAQDFLGVPAGGLKIVCVSGSGTIYINDDSGDCYVNEPENSVIPTGLHVANATFNESTNSTTISGGTVSFNSVTTAFGGGSATFNNTVSFTGPSVSFQTGVDFNSGIDTSGIDNSGLIETDLLLATGIGGANVVVGNALTIQSGATINLGGNILHGVAAGVAGTDAVNVAQLVAATSGIATDITALETATATHTTQITELQGTTATHATQIAAVEAVNATQSSQISAIETVNATQSNQISAIQTVNTTQSSQIGALQTVTATHSSQIGALEAAQNLFEGQIDTLFDLRSIDRRDMKQGVAAAMSMAAAPMPSEPGRVAYAINGATFRGEYAVGGSLTYRLPTPNPMAVNVGFSYAGNKNNGARIGIAGEF